nr:hypothetical protein HmN_000517800 [Hymenolepis microstoma]
MSLLCDGSFSRQDHLKYHMSRRHRGFNAERDTRVCVDTADFLKYTRIGENGVNEDVGHTDVGNSPDNLTSSTTQDMNLQLGISSGSANLIIPEEKPENIFATHCHTPVNLSSMRKKLNR